jgi:membrane protein implicated in regulation of membrane protease activity
MIGQHVRTITFTNSYHFLDWFYLQVLLLGVYSILAIMILRENVQITPKPVASRNAAEAGKIGKLEGSLSARDQEGDKAYLNLLDISQTVYLAGQRPIHQKIQK